MKFVEMKFTIIALLSISLFSNVISFSSEFQKMLNHQENHPSKSIFDLDSMSDSNNQKKNSLFDNNILDFEDKNEKINENPNASLFSSLKNEIDLKGI